MFRTAIYSETSCRTCGGNGKLKCDVCCSKRTSRDAATPSGHIKCGNCKGSGRISKRGKCDQCVEGLVTCPECEQLRALSARLRDSRPAECPDFFDSLKSAAKERYAYAEVELVPERRVSAQRVSKQTEAWFRVNAERATEKGFYALAFVHRERLQELFTNLHAAVHSQVGFFSADVPFDFATKDEKVVLVLKGMLAGFTFNTYRLDDAEQRAAETIKILVAPCLSMLDEKFQGSGLSYYSLVVSYGSESFVDPNSEELRPECVAIVIPEDRCHLFARGRLTLGELVSQCDCYVADRFRSREGGLMKVNLVMP